MTLLSEAEIFLFTSSKIVDETQAEIGRKLKKKQRFFRPPAHIPKEILIYIYDVLVGILRDNAI